MCCIYTNLLSRQPAHTQTYSFSLFLLLESAVDGHVYLKQHTHTMRFDLLLLCPTPPYSQSYGLRFLSVHFTLVGRQCSSGVTNETHSSSILLFFFFVFCFLTWSHIHHCGLCWCPKPRSKYGNGWDLSPVRLGSSSFTTFHWSYSVATVAREGGWLIGSKDAPTSIFGHMYDFPFLV